MSNPVLNVAGRDGRALVVQTNEPKPDSSGEPSRLNAGAHAPGRHGMGALVESTRAPNSRDVAARTRHGAPGKRASTYQPEGVLARMAALGSSALLGVVSMAQVGCHDFKPSRFVFEGFPTWTSDLGMNLRPGGVLAVPFDPKTTCKDLMVSNGNDVAPQSLTIYRNRMRMGHAPFANKIDAPDWYSSDIGYHGTIAAGLIDDDDQLDVAAALLFQHPTDNTTEIGLLPGGVKIYPGGSCGPGGSPSCLDATASNRSWLPLSHAPAQPGHLENVTQSDGLTIHELPVWAVALGDANGDGRLDLAVGVLYETASAGPVVLRVLANELPPRGHVRIYFNKAGTFDERSFWQSDEKYYAGAVSFADMNQDGLADLVVAADRPYIYLGKRNSDGLVTLPTTASWIGKVPKELENSQSFGVGLSVGWLKERKDCNENSSENLPVVAVSMGCLFASDIEEQRRACAGRVLLYSLSERSRDPIWTSVFKGSPYGVALADLTGDGMADVVMDSWWEIDGSGKAQSSALRIFENQSASSPKFNEAFYQSDLRFVGHAISVADFSGRSIERRECTFSGGAVPKHVFTVTSANVDTIVAVDRTTPDGQRRRLGRHEYATTPGSDWISLATPLANGEKLRVLYDRARAPDIAVGAFEVIGTKERPPTGSGVLFFNNKNQPNIAIDCAHQAAWGAPLK